MCVHTWVLLIDEHVYMCMCRTEGNLLACFMRQVSHWSGAHHLVWMAPIGYLFARASLMPSLASVSLFIVGWTRGVRKFHVAWLLRHCPGHVSVYPLSTVLGLWEFMTWWLKQETLSVSSSWECPDCVFGVMPGYHRRLQRHCLLSWSQPDLPFLLPFFLESPL